MSKKFNNLNIKSKMLLSIVLTLVISFTILGTVILSNSVSALNEVSYNLATSDGEKMVSRLETNVGKCAAEVNTVAESIEALVASGNMDRSTVNQMLYSLIDGNAAYVTGVFTLWEPNAFDGKDAEYVNKEGTDSTGRFMSWYYSEGSHFALKTYDPDATYAYETYYDDTKSIMGAVISEPYYNQIDGEDLIVSVVTAPIIVNGEFLGIVGLEWTAALIQNTFEEMAANQDLVIRLISYEKTYLAAETADLIYTESTISDAAKAAVDANETYSEFGDGYYKTYLPMVICNEDTPWAIVAAAPEQSQAAISLLILGLAMFAAVFFVIILVIWKISNVVAKPIKLLAGFAAKIAHGEMDFTIKINDKSETGQLAEAFRDVQKAVSKMVNDVDRTATEIIAGNLLNRADLASYPGEYGKIMSGLNKIMDSISYLIRNIKESAENVSSASQQISSGSQSLAQGSTEQAAAIEEISATVNEIVDQTRRNSETAAKAKNYGEKVHGEAENGSGKMKDLLLALEEINQASSNISNIIKTIEDIAFQTNILALNASVEAARAGVHGKGFAVVAEEVKNLATKSAEAAKETNALIKTSIVKAERGVNIGENMRASLSEMVVSINSVVSAIKEIADASMHEVETIEQLNTGLEQISEVVQSNTATAEESASSSEELAAQAEMLNETVAKYKVSTEG